MFHTTTNIFSPSTLELLAPWSGILSTDKSSYDIWPAESTNNRTAPKCFTHTITDNLRLTVISELFNNPKLPCYKKMWLKNADIAIQKIPTGAFIPKHSDYCMFSLTVFLSTVAGGEFTWWDDKNTYVIEPEINKGIFAFYETFTRGSSHRVEPVINGLRSTLQLFVFDKFNKTNSTTKSVIIEE
jgi:hypothetical protein